MHSWQCTLDAVLANSWQLPATVSQTKLIQAEAQTVYGCNQQCELKHYLMA